MTLVVSDISSLGVVMVGDSAVTRRKVGQREEVVPNAVKVQYCQRANIGVSMWGYANAGPKRLDHWMASFLENDVKATDTVRCVGTRLAQKLNPVLSASRKPWKDLVCGIHVAGFKDGLPCLYHVHCGHDNEPAHELRLYRDFPDDQNWSEYFFNYLLQHSFIHLRNGYHPLFAPLFDNILEYSKALRAHFNISFPMKTLQARFDFYKLLVKFVAGVLPVSGLAPRVNDALSAIAFTEDGIAIDERLSLSPDTRDTEADLTNYF
jgi:hypothetical protein